MEPTLWTLADVARYLKMNERTVAKLASSGGIPGAKIANQWRFKPSLIEEWLIQQIKNLSQDQIEQRALDTTPAPISLSSLLAAETCRLSLDGARREEAIRLLAQALADADRIQGVDDFVTAVLHREYLASTAIGDGIAVPHARHSTERFCAKPAVALGRSARGIDFDAIDGRPVHLVFLIGAPDDATHLRIMAQISRLFRDGGLRNDLLAARTAEDAVRIVIQSERRQGQSNDKSRAAAAS